ncbi:MAG TPA: 4-hydroxy-tetrahydrodipicolinate synthase [Lachnospiraceae bacterium]|nr:4-hydroxy-tetrahydrodipicolinate synthase [Lachnospiraceae bacterium]
MAIFKGAGVAICTPFKKDGSVDYERFTEQIEYQIAGGTDSIIVCGTTGESACLTHEEHTEVIKHCVDVVNKRVPVIAGAGSNCTDEAVFRSKEAERCGADALLVVTPYYNKATQKSLIEHYRIVAESSALPIIMYNVPSRTGLNIAPETAAYLFENVDTIVAIKEASGNISQIAKLMSLTDGRIDLYSGNDDQITPIMSLGGLGVISVLSNIAPGQTHDICASFLEGDVQKSRELQLKAIPLCNALFCEVNPMPVKKALELQGRDTGVLRRPLCEIEPEHTELLKKEMKAYGVL